ncbi:AMP-binding protein [Rhodococcus opacus]|uniref:AMP-binding protein n=1 Tax=Rhodococcus opacus TaxID=37919 RepID=UPI00247565A4|nr:AMP-binding protein [Rhodococcus opacus]MDH6291277.1 crotonobetaine/carnitine-CoA ligase [Rhodococcus opacus]
MLEQELAPARTVHTTDTVLDALARAVAAAPNQVFLDFDGDLYTFGDVDRLTNAFAHELSRLGVTAGHTVATILDNNIDQIVSWLAVNKIGGIWVPLNTAYRGEFLSHQIRDSLAKIVITEADYLANVAAVSNDLVNVELVLQRGNAGAVPVMSLPLAMLDEHRGRNTEPVSFQAKPSDLAFLMYTSGTTGPSKGCMVSHNYICHQGYQSNATVPPLPGEIMYTCLPLFHMAAVDTTMSAILSHSRIAIGKRFSVSSFWSEIERSGAGNVRLLSSIYPLMAKAPDSPEMKRCIGQLRAVTGYAAPEIAQIWKERFGVHYFNSHAYGQSEGVRISTGYHGEPTPPDGSCGRIDSDAFEVVILDDDDNILPEGSIGEIAYRPRKPHVMFEGFWRRPEDTMKAWRNLWMHTGDLGRIEGSYLFFVDRKKDYLRSRGENISSFEIERAFMRHDAVSEVAAHAISDGIAEDCLKLTVVLRENAVLTEEELCLWAIDHVPYFAVPQFIEFRDELPKTPTGKITKHSLRADGRTASTWDRDSAGIMVRRR